MERKQIIEKLQLRSKQIVLLPFVRVSEEIIQTDGKMNDPSAEVTCWLAFFSAISLFANHYPWHTLLFYPSIKMREGRKRAREKERERWMHLVTCSSISWCAGSQFKKYYQLWMIFSSLDNLSLWKMKVWSLSKVTTHDLMPFMPVVQMMQHKLHARGVYILLTVSVSHSNGAVILSEHQWRHLMLNSLC